MLDILIRYGSGNAADWHKCSRVWIYDSFYRAIGDKMDTPESSSIVR